MSSRLKVVRIANKLLAPSPSSITPSSPNLPWTPLGGASREHLFHELEALYWDGVASELENIVRALHAWHHAQQQPDLADVTVEDEDDDKVYGFDTFLDQVSGEARERVIREFHARAESSRYGFDPPTVYEAALSDVIRERKAELVSTHLKASVRKALEADTPTLSRPQQRAWMLLQAAGLLDIDKLIEHRPPPDGLRYTKRPAVPQLAPAKFDKDWVPKFAPLRCSRPNCKAPICGSMYKSQGKEGEPSTICEDCYWRFHHGRPSSSSYVKSYKHCVLLESVSPETSRSICLCRDVAHLDAGGKPVSLFPVGRTAQHVDVAGPGTPQCGLLKLGEAVASAKYRGLEELAGQKGVKVLKEEEKQKRRSYKTGIDAARFEALLQEGPTDPGNDNDVSSFIRQFADPNPFGHVHMSLRVGPLVVENGVAHTKGGARISLRELPVFHERACQRADRVLLVDGTPNKGLWKSKQPATQPKRYKAIMKQVVGLPFSGMLPHDAELEIVKDLLDASESMNDRPDTKEKDGGASHIQAAMEKLKAIIGSRARTYLRHVADVLTSPSTNLTWSPKQNNCLTFCNKIVDTDLFRPLVGGEHHTDDKTTQPLYLLSFVCPESGYLKPSVRTKHDVPSGLTEDYLRRFYFGRHHDGVDMLDSLQEYWYDWGAFGGPLFRNLDMFPWDCTEAYGRCPTKCGDCNLAKHLWAFPFDSWSATALHLARGPDMYAPPAAAAAAVEPLPSASGPSADANESWARNRLYVLAASSKLYRGAVAMARTPLFCRTTAWLHKTNEGLLEMRPSLARVRMGGIHRAQPFSHDFDTGTHADFFLAPWALLPRDEQIADYKKLRDARAALADVDSDAASARLVQQPFRKATKAARDFGGFGGNRSGVVPPYSTYSSHTTTTTNNAQIIWIADAGFTPDACDAERGTGACAGDAAGSSEK
ncbi:hypothetical protein JDV02_002218 [Purpureocillium takamizusanense]|uniref:Uncharacterized protein n=1 Tax=Purpureocillium takamizusanense TaxID=2060973 RepID=A0A9Q8QBB0_9HYPO|nr:uncharacterized protein JDV02_002218 [Purpureocillium takamizusanense]UNI15712.1 hypothetical protein JDV02_002218 [Purpureocillium takamizusanense]